MYVMILFNWITLTYLMLKLYTLKRIKYEINHLYEKIFRYERHNFVERILTYIYMYVIQQTCHCMFLSYHLKAFWPVFIWHLHSWVFYSITCFNIIWHALIFIALPLQKKVAPKAVVKKPVKSKFSAFRAQMKNKNSASEDKTFDFGFFKVQSPVKSPKPHCAGKSMSVVLTDKTSDL